MDEACREQLREGKGGRQRIRSVQVICSEMALPLVHCETLNKSFSLWGPQNKEGSAKMVSQGPFSLNIFRF